MQRVVRASEAPWILGLASLMILMLAGCGEAATVPASPPSGSALTPAVTLSVLHHLQESNLKGESGSSRA